MSEPGASVRDLPSAVSDAEAFNERLAGRLPAVFLDYDGTLTPIVDRPGDAVISASMREAVRALARRCTVCVVSGRDRPVVQQLMGVDDLVVAGSHGFDIWRPDAGTLEHEASSGFDALLARVTNRVQDEAGAIEGALIDHVHLHPRQRRDRRGSGTGRVLHPADQPHRDRPPRRGCRARLQKPALRA
jgi:trehalose 6-phosphate phosphatase